MSEPIKDNAHISANQQEFEAAYERARTTFARINGVVHVGFGLKQTNGNFGDSLAIIVFVDEKKARQDLSADQLIPPTFEGYRTDVRIVPRTQASAANTARYATIQGGIQISTEGQPSAGGATVSFETGTIACVVRKRNNPSRDNVYILSNHHVMYAMGHKEGDYVYHPAPISGSTTPGFVALGPVQESGPPENIPYAAPGQAPIDVFVDCAIARLDIDSKCLESTCTQDTTPYSPSIIDLVQVTPPTSEPLDPENRANIITDVRSVIGLRDLRNFVVTKVGRTTRKTQGNVVAVDSAFRSVDPNNPAVILFRGTNCIEIQGVGPSFFSEKGDSGSLVLDDQNRAVGLLSQGPPPNAQPDATSMACHIVPVLDYLNICIPCASTGTSHGSDHAIDGSGIAPSPLGDFTAPAGQIVFTSEGDILTSGRRPSVIEPVSLTDDEARRMQELLATFRATSLGLELHRVFAEARREIGYLIRNSRPVKVVWHRHKGPAYLAHVLNHLAGHADSVPYELQGVTRRALLVRMREVLGAHGSNPLRHALEQYGDDLIEMLTREDCDSVAGCITWMQERESEMLRRAESTKVPA